MKKKYKFLIPLLLLCIQRLVGVDIDFGVFNYKGSRLKKIEMYVIKRKKLNKVHEVQYEYDNNGYLISRKYMMVNNRGDATGSLVSTQIKYDLDNNKIVENVDRLTGYKKPMPIILEYYYDKDRRLISYKRIDSNIYNDEMSLSRHVHIEYNDRGDIIAIYNNEHVGSYDPTCSLL